MKGLVFILILLISIGFVSAGSISITNGTYPIVAEHLNITTTSNSTVNQTDYWGTYYYTLFADYENWNEAYGWGNPSGVYLPLVGGTISGGLIVNGGITSNERIKLTQTSTTALTVTDDADVIKFIINTQANKISTVKLIPTIDDTFDIGESDGETALRYRDVFISRYLTDGNGAEITVENIVNNIYKQLAGDNNYLYNNSVTMFFNDTKLNQTIDARMVAGTDTVWNITNSNYLYNNSGVLFFNETKMNSTIESLDTDTDTDTLWNITTSNYLYNNSGVLYFNETKMNDTVASNNYITDGNTLWDNIYGFITSWLNVSTSNGYLYNDSNYIYFNETKLNQTISALEIDTDTVWNISTSNYLYNNSRILYFNETKMNNTVNSFGFLKADGSVPLTSQWNYGAFNINGSGNYSQQNLTISQNSTTVKFNTGGKGWCIGNCP